MKPVRTERSNFTYRGPSPEVGDLPCRREGGVVYSTWELSSDERIAIAEGANIELGIFHEPIPPVSLAIDQTPVDLGPPPSAHKAGKTEQ
jgi:hypothetical protein